MPCSCAELAQRAAREAVQQAILIPHVFLANRCVTGGRWEALEGGSDELDTPRVDGSLCNRTLGRSARGLCPGMASGAADPNHWWLPDRGRNRHFRAPAGR